jgi:hypothetical protein
LGDGSKAIFEFIFGHPNASISDSNCASLWVGFDPNFQLTAIGQYRGISYTEKSQLIQRVTCITYEFTEKNLLVAIQAVDNQIQQSADLQDKEKHCMTN